ncbi:MAG: dockerin type I domain-containing protein, partial [Planctomycetota bacterium]
GGYQGHLFASGVPYQADQSTFAWSDLAIYAPQPYDPSKPVYVYAVINDGLNLPVFTAYSAPITPPNFVPFIVAPAAQDFNAGGRLVFSTANGNSLRIVDPLTTHLPDSMVEVDVRVMDGTLKLAQFSDAVHITGDDSDLLRLEGTAADISSLLEGLVYTPLENTFFDDSLTMHVGRFPEFYADTIEAHVPLDAHPLSVGMETGFEAAAIPYVQGSGPGNLLDHVVIHDFASGHIAGATITIDDFVAGQDLLDLDIEDQRDTGIHASFNAHTGVLMLTGFASVETYQHALHQVVFDSTSSGGKSLTVRLGDDVNDRAEFTAPINITVVNQAPVVSPGDGLIHRVGEGAAALVPTLTVTDPENGMLTGATIAFTADSQGEESLLFLNQNGITGQFDAASGVLTLTGTASAADYTQALRSVRFNKVDVAPWQNYGQPLDTNLDGHISAIDALVVINDLEREGSRALSGSPGLFRLDVSGDGFLSAIDALVVINHIDEELNSDPGTSPAGSAGNQTASRLRSLTITVSDGQAINGQRSELIPVFVGGPTTTLNAPVLTVPSNAVRLADDGTPVPLAPALTLSSDDQAPLLGADVMVTGNFMAGEDVLHATWLLEGIQAQFDEMHGVLHLRGAATAEAYEFALQNVTYANHATIRSGAPRTVMISVQDGFTTPASVSVTVEASALPVVEAGFGALSYTQGQTTLTIDPELVVEYMGAQTLTGATAAIVGNY